MNIMRYLLLVCCIAVCNTMAAQSLYTRCDVNKDRNVDISDIVAIINTIASGAADTAADVNKDAAIDISDIVYVINAIAADSADPAVEAGLCPDKFHPHVIDMGDAGKWACCNVGALTPLDAGECYCWGETELKTWREWDWEYYLHRDEEAGEPAVKLPSDDIAQTEYDVATVKWGDTWCIPNDEQFKKLLDLAYEWTEMDGQSMRIITAPNGNKLSLNANDMTYYYTSVYKTDSLWGYYNDYGKWTEDWQYVTGAVYFGLAPWYDPARALVDYSYLRKWEKYLWSSPHLIRPMVCVPKPEPEKPDAAVEGGYCPDKNHPHAIDMGTAGKWACCNVGAKAPWETGGYYCWGGTKELSFYGATPENETACIWSEDIDGEGTVWWGYKWGMWNEDGVLLPSYDVARVLWGSSWRMPVMERYEQLNAEGFSKEKAWLNGTPGLMVNAPNGRHIFLPYCGKKVEDEFRYGMYDQLEYWTAESESKYMGECLEPNAGAMYHNYWYDPAEGETWDDCNTDFAKIAQARGFGLPVRAVQ